MYATWPLVFSALVSGFIGGFLIPDRPQSRPVTAVSVLTGPEHGNSEASSLSQPAGAAVPKKNHAIAASNDGPSATSANDAIDSQRSPCAIDSWPYHAPGCLDRAAAVEPEYSVIDVKRVDPAQSLEAEGNTPRERAAKAQQTEVSDRSERAEEADDPKRADDAPKEPAKAKPRPQARPEWRARPAGRGSADNRRGREDPNVVIRGPDGRLYLAPRYRHVPPPSYYIRQTAHEHQEVRCRPRSATEAVVKIEPHWFSWLSDPAQAGSQVHTISDVSGNGTTRQGVDAPTAGRFAPERVIQSPYVSIANRQAELMMRISAEFGFTPASRSRISTPFSESYNTPVLMQAVIRG